MTFSDIKNGYNGFPTSVNYQGWIHTVGVVFFLAFSLFILNSKWGEQKLVFHSLITHLQLSARLHYSWHGASPTSEVPALGPICLPRFDGNNSCLSDFALASSLGKYYFLNPQILLLHPRTSIKKCDLPHPLHTHTHTPTCF